MSTLVSAAWVLPVAQPPIRDGAVLVDGDVVREVGLAAELIRHHPEADVVHFDEGIVVPGLVNAHTHLALSAAAGLLEPAPFSAWLPRLVAGMNAWDHEDRAASAALGALRCLQAGVTVVGDITYGPESLDAARELGVGGVFFWEVLGIEAGAFFGEIEAKQFPMASSTKGIDRDVAGISPHSVYTSGPGLLTVAHTFASVGDKPFAIHLAESADETTLLTEGAGPLANVAARAAHGFTPPGVSPVAYAHGLGVLEGATLIHLGHASVADIALVAAGARGVVACPRSNRFLHNPIADVERLLGAGATVGLGTDSSASNDDLDLMQEARALRESGVPVTDHDLLELVTVGGAAALGVDDRFGTLAPGMQGDLAIFDVGTRDDPEGAFVQRAGAPTLLGVMSAGRWRVIDGRPLADSASIERTASGVTEKARRAIG